MPKQRDPKRNEAFEIWKQHHGEITNRAIAEQLNLPEKTIGGWKSKDKWNDKLNGVLQSKIRSTPKRNESKNKAKRSGNPNPPNQFTKRNKAAETHGFFAKYLPPETREIMESMNERSPADLIWDQIQLQYAAIIRAQKIMFVADQDDMTRELKKTKESDNASEEEYEIQFAWDKHATFLNAQSRAMSELRGLIKQFNELAYEDDERRLKLEQMQLGIDKTKAEIDKINSIDDEATINGLDQLTEAIRKSASMFKGDV